MIGWDWQSGIVITLVAAAAVYLLLRASRLLRVRRASGCATGCVACPSAKPQSPSDLDVSFDQLAQSAERLKSPTSRSIQ